MVGATHASLWLAVILLSIVMGSLFPLRTPLRQRRAFKTLLRQRRAFSLQDTRLGREMQLQRLQGQPFSAFLLRVRPWLDGGDVLRPTTRACTSRGWVRLHSERQLLGRRPAAGGRHLSPLRSRDGTPMHVLRAHVHEHMCTCAVCEGRSNLTGIGVVVN